MKRRDFLFDTLFAATSLTAGIGISSCKQQNKAEALTTHNNIDDYITEPAKKIKVLAKTDVLVIGGGPAGVSAAIAASRAGAETYLVERYNHLGGLWTGGLVLPLLSTHGTSRNGNIKQVIHGIGGEIFNRLKEMNMSINDVNPTVDPEAAKYVLDDMIEKSGVKVLYHSLAAGVIMNGNIIEGVYIESKSGRNAILAKVVIDCTGDGDIYALAGENYEEMKYHIGLVHRLGNVDRIDKSAIGYKKIYVGDETPINGVTWYNMHGEDDQCGTDILNLSRLQQKYRKTIWENFEKIKKVPGYEKIYLLDTASQLGVRASRILDGTYRLTLDDTMTYKNFEDAIGISGAWTTLFYNGKKITPDKRPYWQIPYRSLLPKKIDNLIVAGRCFCFEKELVEDTRVIGTCLVTGQGAGVAAALSVKSKTNTKDLDVKEMRKMLLNQNVWLG